jgi:hypothetical protein
MYIDDILQKCPEKVNVFPLVESVQKQNAFYRNVIIQMAKNISIADSHTLVKCGRIAL